MEDTPDGMIEELRFQAIEEAAETGVAQEETLYWEAADMLQEFLTALRGVASGVLDRQDIQDLLDPIKRFRRALERERR